jgi:hypothetical protein
MIAYIHVVAQPTKIVGTIMTQSCNQPSFIGEIFFKNQN